MVLQTMAFNKTFEHIADVRRYHYFRTIWQPKENKVLVCQFENGNRYEMFAIKTCDERGTMVGHLSRKISLLQSLSLILV